MVDLGYTKTKLHGWTIFVYADFPSRFSGNSSDLFPDGTRSDSVVVNSSRYAGVFKFDVVFSNRLYSLFLKFFFYRSVKDFLLHQFRPSRAVRAFRAGLMLCSAGISAPVSIAVGRRRFLGLVETGSFLITSEVSGSRLFYELLDELSFSALTRVAKRELIIALGSTVGRMHHCGIFHGDLRLGNILVRQIDKRYEFTFLDNERTRKFTRLPLRLMVKNLVQVGMYETGLSVTDRLRFFRAYLRSCPSCVIPERVLAGKVWRKTRKRLSKRAGREV